MILYPEETSWNTLRFDKRNYTIQKAKEQQKEIIKKSQNNMFLLMIDALRMPAE